MGIFISFALYKRDNNKILVPTIFIVVPGLKLVNSAAYTALDIILNKAYLGYCILTNVILYFGPPARIFLELETTRDFYFVSILPSTVLLMPISTKIEGLLYAAAFAYTDYKYDPYSLYVQLLRYRSLDGIILLSKVLENIIAVEERLELLSNITVRNAESWGWLEEE
ncbi:hypothetical protein V2W45_1520002 [Cenococcum geophilum]